MINLLSISLLSLVLNFFMICGVQAASEGRTDLIISGEIVDKPVCEISKGETIHISFEIVGVNKVASGIYKKDIPYTFSCDANATGYAFSFVINGDKASFDADGATVVTGEQSDLGVKLFIDGKPFKVNTEVKVNINALPKLEAQLVQKSGATLEEGDFSAVATLNVVFQ